MIYRVHAFTEVSIGGNPAGVVLETDHYSEEQMFSVAKEVGYSETAFVSTSKYADFKIRYFTPSDEVDLCGHATIATFTLLFDNKIISPGKYTIETKAGILPVTLESSGLVLMTQLKPKAYELLSNELIANSLGLSESDIISPSQVFSTGLKDIIIQVKDRKSLKNIKPDFKTIADISKEHRSTGYHVFTLDSEYTARCRNFAPLYAIDEESATGTASGAVSGYIMHHGLIDTSDGVHHLIYEQGIEMNLPSIIHGYIKMKNKEVIEVVIGGKGKIQQS